MGEEEGSIAVEFAFVAPALIILIAAVFEGSLLLYTWGNMEHIGRQAARGAAIGEFTLEQAETFIVSHMEGSIGSPSVNADVRFETGTEPIDNRVIVNISLPAAELSGLQPFGLFRIMILSTTVTMHREVSS